MAVTSANGILAPPELLVEDQYGYDDEVEQETVTVLLLVVRIISALGIIVTMFAMGCVISIKDFSRKELHLPQSVMIGLGLQSVIQPLVGYLIAKVLDMPKYDALAIIILSCCPVSPYCAVLVYYGEGFVIVGLCLAMFTTALAIGLIPFWFSFYSSSWSEDYYVIGTPHDIVLTEASIFIPVACGVLFKRYFGPKRARKVARVCSFAFFIACILGPILNAIDHPEHYVGDWKLWVGGILLPLVGFLCGFLLTVLLSLPYEACSAVSLAVGTPNWIVATNIAWEFFADDIALREVLTLVSIFSIAMPIEGFIWSVTYCAIEEFFRKIYPKCCVDDDSDDEDDEKDVKKGVEKKKTETTMIILGQVLDEDEDLYNEVAEENLFDHPTTSKM